MIENYEQVLRETSELNLNRILLRKVRIVDAKDILEYASDPDTVKYLVWAGVKTLDAAKKAVEEYYIPAPGFFVMEHKETGKCIGAIDLRVAPEHDKASFGYVLNRKYWNQGYMSEALSALLKFAFQVLELNRVESEHYAGNEASGRVMQKCGMKFEGMSPQAVMIKGVFRDVVRYGILRANYGV